MSDNDSLVGASIHTLVDQLHDTDDPTEQDRIARTIARAMSTDVATARVWAADVYDAAH